VPAGSPTPSGHPAPYSAQISDEAIAARNRLLASIGEGTDLPALGSSVSRVVQMASSNDEAVRNLASFVLADAGLTQKILRVANTVVYRSYSGAPITTVSKAIFLLGFETVKTNALAMLLVDGMSGNRAQSVANSRMPKKRPLPPCSRTWDASWWRRTIICSTARLRP